MGGMIVDGTYDPTGIDVGSASVSSSTSALPHADSVLAFDLRNE
jgi:hypothetical protein